MIKIKLSNKCRANVLPINGRLVTRDWKTFPKFDIPESLAHLVEVETLKDDEPVKKKSPPAKKSAKKPTPPRVKETVTEDDDIKEIDE